MYQMKKKYIIKYSQIYTWKELFVKIKLLFSNFISWLLLFTECFVI
jgi:hypothetical protein